MYLVDTNVISALAPSKREGAEKLVEWLDRASPWLYLSVITAAEVRAGIAKAEREGATTKAARLADWWSAIEHIYGERILPFDLQCAAEAGAIIDHARAHQPGFEDIAIAATARAHDLVVLTRNLRHFAPLGARCVDPFAQLPKLPE